jgi:hypothetical protein
LRFGLGRCDLEIVELDEKSLPDLAVKTLGISSAEISARLKALGAAVGRPWRKEQKLACMSAWIAVSRRG